MSRRFSNEDGVLGEPRRERIERGMLRYLLLHVLSNGPKHGYEIIKWLDERTHGRYSPSPGIVYPTLQHLGDQGLIRSERTEDKSVYYLCPTGETELESQADFIKDFWQRYTQPMPPTTIHLTSEFVYEELQQLHTTVETGVRVLSSQEDQTRLVLLRKALEDCKNEIRILIVQPPGSQESTNN